MKDETPKTYKGITRDDYFRCKVCKRLWADGDCIVDPEKGLLCPNGCERPFIQPDYELPTQD